MFQTPNVFFPSLAFLILAPLGWPNIFVWSIPCYLALLSVFPALWLKAPFHPHEPAWARRARQFLALLNIVGYPTYALSECCGLLGAPLSPYLHPVTVAICALIFDFIFVLSCISYRVGESPRAPLYTEREVLPPRAPLVPPSIPAPTAPAASQQSDGVVFSSLLERVTSLNHAGDYAGAEAILSIVPPLEFSRCTPLLPLLLACHLELARAFYCDARLLDAAAVCREILALDADVAPPTDVTGEPSSHWREELLRVAGGTSNLLRRAVGQRASHRGVQLL